MTTQTYSHSTPTYSPVVKGHRKGPMVALLETLWVWSERSRQRHQLNQAEDRMLADIGIGRGAALVEAGKPFWRA